MNFELLRYEMNFLVEWNHESYKPFMCLYYSGVKTV